MLRNLFDAIVLYLQDHGLDLTRLLDATEYKEHYRADMIRWGEEKRNADPSYFCNLVTTGPGSEKPVWIISDARRLTDVAYFEEHYAEQLIRVRVQAKESVRESRGWKFAAGGFKFSCSVRMIYSMYDKLCKQFCCSPVRVWGVICGWTL